MPPATAGASAAQARAHLVELLTPLVADAGYDLEDVTVAAAGRRSLVRVIVDRDGGIDLDAVAVVSRVVSDALDGDPKLDATLKGSYVLEVSSPGVDRPLVERRHWRRAIGRLVRADSGGKPVTGRVVAVDDDGVLLDVDGKRHVHGWSSLGPGKVQVEFQHADHDRAEEA